MSGADLLSFVSDAINWGALGGMVALLLSRKVVTRGEFDESVRQRDENARQRDEWKAQYEREKDAHQVSREALIAATQRGDAGVAAARLVADMVGMMREQVRHDREITGE